MKRVTATFEFSEYYDSATFTRQEVTIVLKIDYDTNQFSISPPYGSDKFGFINKSRDYKKWIAVLNCIKKAIDFGNQELGVTPKPDQSS